jgi:predicted DNA-binding ribbon-helix-helix protein
MSYFQDRTREAVSSSSRPKTSESVTLRLDKDILDKLRREAKEKQVSLNVLVGQIALQHLDWHAYASKAGFLAVTRGTIQKTLEKITEKDAVEIGEYVAKKESKEFITMLRNDYSVTSALQVLDTWLKIVGYPYRHEVRGSEHSYIIQHEMGKKWSLYLKELFRLISEDFGLPRVDFDVNEDMLSFKVDIGSIFLR